MSYNPTKEERDFAFQKMNDPEMQKKSRELFDTIPQLSCFTLKYVGPNDLRACLTVTSKDGFFPEFVNDIPVILEEGRVKLVYWF